MSEVKDLPTSGMTDGAVYIIMKDDGTLTGTFALGLSDLAFAEDETLIAEIKYRKTREEVRAMVMRGIEQHENGMRHAGESFKA